MNTDEFIERLGDQKISWKNTFYPQIKDITKKVFNKMSEVMEHRANCFELYGLDFVIDQSHKCWLIEANMSPACAHRKGQKWLTEMADDMSDGMVNIIENLVLKNMAAQKIQYEGPLQDKIRKIKKPELKNWEMITYERYDLDKCKPPNYLL
jgi:hypothetical protein